MECTSKSLGLNARSSDVASRIQEACSTLSGCTDVVNAAIDALHRQRSSTQRLRQQPAVRGSFADAVKHLQSHYGPIDKNFLADDRHSSSWDDSIPEEDNLGAHDDAMPSYRPAAPSTLPIGACAASPSAPPFPTDVMAAAGGPAVHQPSRPHVQSGRTHLHVSPPYSGVSGASAEDMPLFCHAHEPSAVKHDDHQPFTSPATPSSHLAAPASAPALTSPAALTSSCSSLSLPSPSQRRYDSYLTSSAEDPQIVGMYGHHPASPSCPPPRIGSVLGGRLHVQPSAPPASATEFVDRRRSTAGDAPLSGKPSRINLSPICTASPGSPSPTKRLPGDHDHHPADGGPGPLPVASPGRRHFGRASSQPRDAAPQKAGRPRPLQTSQEHNRVADGHLKAGPQETPPHGHAAPPSPLGMRNPMAAGLAVGRENAEPRAGGRPVATAVHGASPDVASPSSPFGRITSPLEESAAMLRSMRRGR